MRLYNFNITFSKIWKFQLSFPKTAITFATQFSPSATTVPLDLQLPKATMEKPLSLKLESIKTAC